MAGRTPLRLIAALVFVVVIGGLITPALAGQKFGGHGFHDGGNGNHHIRNCTIRGTHGDDSLRGTTGVDVICAGAGDDGISTLRGDDLILAGNGDDLVHARGGVDRIEGGAGRDVLYGGHGADRIIGGGHRPDVVVGNGGVDSLSDRLAGVDECFQDERVGVGIDC